MHVASHLLCDLHLDLAWNATKPDGALAASLRALRAAGVLCVGATIYAEPGREAGRQCVRQLAVYRRWERDGRVRVVRGASDVGKNGLGLLVLMEGADAMCLRGEAGGRDAWRWWDAGVRAVGLAWKTTRFAAGTGDTGGLTTDGVRLIRELDDAAGGRMIHDASHLATDAVTQLLDVAAGPVMASHSNCRALVGDDPVGRHLTDDAIRGIARRGGVVGINLYDRFLLGGDYGTRRATPADWARHVRHVLDVTGTASCVALGSDADGGFGPEHLPVGCEDAARWPAVLGEALADAGLADAAVSGVLWGNASAFLTRALPCNLEPGCCG